MLFVLEWSKKLKRFRVQSLKRCTEINLNILIGYVEDDYIPVHSGTRSDCYSFAESNEHLLHRSAPTINILKLSELSHNLPTETKKRNYSRSMYYYAKKYGFKNISQLSKACGWTETEWIRARIKHPLRFDTILRGRLARQDHITES